MSSSPRSPSRRHARLGIVVVVVVVVASSASSLTPARDATGSLFCIFGDDGEEKQKEEEEEGDTYLNRKPVNEHTIPARAQLLLLLTTSSILSGMMGNEMRRFMSIAVGDVVRAAAAAADLA